MISNIRITMITNITMFTTTTIIISITTTTTTTTSTASIIIIIVITTTTTAELGREDVRELGAVAVPASRHLIHVIS